MNDTYENWELSQILQTIRKHKQVFREPSNIAEYQLVIDQYYKAIYNGDQKGAVLLGVCRGKISEGLDFSDNAARMVIVTGIPFPQMYDSKVILKRNYLEAKIAHSGQNKINSGREFLSGRDWYN